MFAYSFNVGELDYEIISDFQIKNLEKNIFKKFLARNSKNHIKFEYVGIESENLKLPALTFEEKSIIANFLFPPYIGRGVLVIPPLVRHDEDISDLINKTKSKYDVPLFQSKLVRSRILSLAAKANNVLLLIHLFSIAIFDFSEFIVQIFYLRDRKKTFNNDNLENAIRRLFTVFLPNHNRVMLHSSGIVRNGKAFLFFAPDEGGKTTAIKNAPEGVFLSDDRNILHWVNKRAMVYSTPWGSMKTAPTKAEVGGMFLLKKSKKFKLQALKPNDMLIFLWDEHIHNWNFLPEFARIKAFDILYDICHKVPTYEMHFPKNFVDWNAIDSIISK